MDDFIIDDGVSTNLFLLSSFQWTRFNSPFRFGNGSSDGSFHRSPLIKPFSSSVPVILAFFTSFKNADSQTLELQVRTIAMNQLYSSGFYINLFSIIPFELLIWDGGTKGWIQLLMFRRFLRFKKLFQLSGKLDIYFIQSKVWPVTKVFLPYVLCTLPCMLHLHDSRC